jgi:hypothetical protein
MVGVLPQRASNRYIQKGPGSHPTSGLSRGLFCSWPPKEGTDHGQVQQFVGQATRRPESSSPTCPRSKTSQLLADAFCKELALGRLR